MVNFYISLYLYCCTICLVVTRSYVFFRFLVLVVYFKGTNTTTKKPITCKIWKLNPQFLNQDGLTVSNKKATMAPLELFNQINECDHHHHHHISFPKLSRSATQILDVIPEIKMDKWMWPIVLRLLCSSLDRRYFYDI